MTTDDTEAKGRALREEVEMSADVGRVGLGLLLDAVGRTNETLQRIADDTGWCRGLDADFDELETILREFEAVAAGRDAW